MHLLCAIRFYMCMFICPMQRLNCTVAVTVCISYRFPAELRGMKDTLEFTAAFIITAKVSGDVATIVARAHSGTRRKSPAEANSRDKTLENLSRPKWTEMKQASSTALVSCAFIKARSLALY